MNNFYLKFLISASLCLQVTSASDRLTIQQQNEEMDQVFKNNAQGLLATRLEKNKKKISKNKRNIKHQKKELSELQKINEDYVEEIQTQNIQEFITNQCHAQKTSTEEGFNKVVQYLSQPENREYLYKYMADQRKKLNQITCDLNHTQTQKLLSVINEGIGYLEGALQNAIHKLKIESKEITLNKYLDTKINKQIMSNIENELFRSLYTWCIFMRFLGNTVENCINSENCLPYRDAAYRDCIIELQDAYYRRSFLHAFSNQEEYFEILDAILAEICTFFPNFDDFKINSFENSICIQLRPTSRCFTIHKILSDEFKEADKIFIKFFNQVAGIEAIETHLDIQKRMESFTRHKNYQGITPIQNAQDSQNSEQPLLETNEPIQPVTQENEIKLENEEVEIVIIDPREVHAEHQARKKQNQSIREHNNPMETPTAFSFSDMNPEFIHFVHQSIYGSSDTTQWTWNKITKKLNDFGFTTTTRLPGQKGKGSAHKIIYMDGRSITVHAPHNPSTIMAPGYFTYIKSGLSRVFGMSKGAVEDYIMTQNFNNIRPDDKDADLK